MPEKNVENDRGRSKTKLEQLVRNQTPGHGTVRLLHGPMAATKRKTKRVG